MSEALKQYAVGGAASRADSFSGLRPEFASGVTQLVKDARAAGIPLQITSAYRSPEVQAQIVAGNMGKYGLGSRRAEWESDVASMGPEAAGRKWRPIMREAGLTKFVAMPGGSQHQRGMAVDFAVNGSLIRDPDSKAAKWLKANAGKYGLSVPMSWEPWQVELAGARGDDVSGGGGADYVAGGEGADQMRYTPEQEQSLYNAYLNGEMSPEQVSDYVSAVRSGDVKIPQGTSIYQPFNYDEQQVQTLFDNYRAGTMTDEQRADYEGNVRMGVVPLPAGQSLMGGSAIQAAIGVAPGQDVITGEPMAMVPAAAETPMRAPQPQSNLGPDIAMEGIQSGLDMSGVGFGGLVGSQPSVGQQMIPEEVTIYGPGSQVPIPPALRKVAGMGVDLGLGVAGLGMAALGGVTGAAGDVAELAGASSQSGRRLAGDLMAMPEAFAGSPSALMRPSAAPVAAPQPGVGGMSRAATGRPQVQPETPTPAQQMRDSRQEIADLSVRAGRGDQEAQRELARLADVDPAAAEAAEQLGFDLPADVLGRNIQLDEVTQILRTLKGTEASEEWAGTVSAATQRAQEIMDAPMDLGTTSGASDAVRRSLEGSQKTLGDQARSIYNEVLPKLSPGTRVAPSNSVLAVNDALRDRSSPDRLDPATKRLFDLVTDDNGVTYTDLKDLKGELFKAKKGQGIYKDAQDWMVNTVYNAISKDMEDFVGAELGPEAAERIKAANGLWRARDEIQDKMIAGFGKDANGSIASLLTRAVRTAERGDDAALRKVLDIVPEDMQRGAVMAAIEELSSSKTGVGENNRAFSFANFNKTWSGLQRHPGIMVQIRKAVGPETFDMMQTMHRVSQKMSKAMAPVQAGRNTGQQAASELFMDRLFARTLDSAAGNVIKGGLAAAAVAPVAGSLAAGAGAALATGVKVGGKRAETAARFMNSPEFQKMAIEAARGKVHERTRSRMLAAPAFKAFTRAANIENPEAWLAATFAAQQVQQEAE